MPDKARFLENAWYEVTTAFPSQKESHDAWHGFSDSVLVDVASELFKPCKCPKSSPVVS